MAVIVVAGEGVEVLVTAQTLSRSHITPRRPRELLSIEVDAGYWYNRHPLITPAHEQILYPHIKGKVDFLECQLHAIGGIEDHIHLIVSIPPKLSISDFAKRIKGSSARYLNQELADDNYKFAWQHEYAVFSLGEQRLEWAIAYVENQKQHHTTGKIVKILERTESISSTSSE